MEVVDLCELLLAIYQTIWYCTPETIILIFSLSHLAIIIYKMLVTAFEAAEHNLADSSFAEDLRHLGSDAMSQCELFPALKACSAFIFRIKHSCTVLLQNIKICLPGISVTSQMT
jgi:hypothetical protein